MAAAHGLQQGLARSGADLGIERAIGHRRPHRRARQVAADHRHAAAHRGHHHARVHLPGPAGPGQRLAHAQLVGVARQALCVVAGVGHLQHDGGQPARGGGARHLGGDLALVVGLVVLLAEDQDAGFGADGGRAQRRQQGQCGKPGWERHAGEHTRRARNSSLAGLDVGTARRHIARSPKPKQEAAMKTTDLAPRSAPAA